MTLFALGAVLLTLLFLPLPSARFSPHLLSGDRNGTPAAARQPLHMLYSRQPLIRAPQGISFTSYSFTHKLAPPIGKWPTTNALYSSSSSAESSARVPAAAAAREELFRRAAGEEAAPPPP